MAVLLGLAMLPAGAIAMQVGLNAIAARQSAFEEALGRRALQSMAAERGTIDELREMLRVLASSPDIQRTGPNCGTWLESVRTRYAYLSAIAVTSEQGIVLCSAPNLPAGFRVPISPLRLKARTRDTFAIGYVDHSAISSQPLLAAVEPVHDQAGRRVGFIGASIAIPQLREMLDRGRALNEARTALVDSEGRVIAQSTVEVGQAAAGLPTPQQIRQMLGSDPAFIEVHNGDAVIVPLHSPDLYAVMSWIPDQPGWRRWLALSASLAAPLLIWLLAIGAGWFAIEIYVARPLSGLETAARGFARGEDVIDPPALANAPDEIRSLRRTLAAMAKTLRGREQRLVEALVEERALLREVNHRVKNNLQMVASLLSIQARNARDESEAWGLARAYDRVQLMALIHQRIYGSGEVRQVRLDDLTTEIARQLVQSRGAQAKDLKIKFDLSEARADTDRVVPLAFLIGEAISSALDELADTGAELTLCLRQDANGEMRFAVDGDVTHIGPPGPGARLIDAFARQVGATLGRWPERPLQLWVRVPPLASASAHEEHAKQDAGAER